jgi:hypothetical protein
MQSQNNLLELVDEVWKIKNTTKEGRTLFNSFAKVDNETIK